MDAALAASGLSLTAVALLVNGLIEWATAARARLLAQLHRHNAGALPDDLSFEPTRPRQRTATDTRFPWLEALLSPTKQGEKIRLDLLRADVKLRLGEYQALRMSTAAVGFALGALLSHDLLIAVAGAVVGYMLPGLLVSMRKKRRMGQLNAQVVECLELIATALRSGFSFLQGLETVRQEVPPPLSDEINKTLREISLGASTEDALNNLAYRTGDADLRLAIIAVLVQRRVGGNLAEVLTNISQTLRERIRIRGEITTLTAQARGSGMIVGMLPIALGVLLYIMNPDYVTVLLVSPTGRLLLAGGIVAEVMGFLLIRKIVEVEF